MPLIESAGSVEIRRRDILAAAAVGLAFGTSSFDAIGQESTEKGQASVGEIIAQYATNLDTRTCRTMSDGPRSGPSWTHLVARSVAMPRSQARSP